MIDLVMKGADKWKEHVVEPWLFHPLLAKADLAWTRLEGINLARADLYMAHLSGATMDKASLFLANLEEAEMELVSLRSADCREAGFFGTNLFGANLERQT